MKRLALVTVVSLTGLAACSSNSDCVEGDTACVLAKRGAATANANTNDAGADTTKAATCTVAGKPHIGLGNIDLAAKDDGAMGADRARVKPYSALASEFSRVLGNAPPSLAAAGPTFGVPSDRWYFEPIASAVFVDTAFDVAFEGCQTLTNGDSQFTTAPTDDSALAQCTTWARKFWSRDATPDQLTACVGVTADTAAESPPRRWAYACATLLTASPFLTY